MTGVVLALVLGVGAVGLAGRRYRCVRRAEPPDAETVQRQLSSDATGRIEWFLLDEYLGDVARDLSTRDHSRAAAARLAMTSGMLGAVLELLTGMFGSGPASWVNAAGALAVGGMGTVLCLEILRRADRRAQRARVGWDRVASALAPRLVGGGPGRGPSRRNRAKD